VHVDTPDTAPTEDEPHKEKAPASPDAPGTPPVKTSTSTAAAVPVPPTNRR
jgi:hypothetical protein